MKIKRNLIALRPPAANAWFQMALPDDECVGSFIQNQNLAANFWLCNRLPSSLQDAVMFVPGSQQYDDRLPWQDEVWLYTDTAGAALSFARVYSTQGALP